MGKAQLTIQNIKVRELNPAPYNPRRWDKSAIEQLTKSIERFGLIDPLVVNGAQERRNVVIGGHFRLRVAKDMGFKEVPVVYVNIPDEAKEKELNLLLNKAQGVWDLKLLAEFDEDLLADVGFTSEELDNIFDIDTDHPEVFDLKKELDKLGIAEVTVKKGDVYKLGDSRLMCGDSTVDADFDKLMDGQKPDMCLTDPPYRLDYLNAKRHGKPTEGFGMKKNRKYLETDVLPDNFTELWMDNVSKHANPNFSIICYENWKNIREIWAEMEKHWRIRNCIIWHLPNRNQGFAGKYKFFSKYDIAMVGASGTVPYNMDPEEGPLQEEYETALYAPC